ARLLFDQILEVVIKDVKLLTLTQQFLVLFFYLVEVSPNLCEQHVGQLVIVCYDGLKGNTNGTDHEVRHEGSHPHDAIVIADRNMLVDVEVGKTQPVVKEK